MLSIKIDDSMVERYAKKWPQKSDKALMSATRSASYLVKVRMSEYATSAAIKLWRPYAPITPFIRKYPNRGGYGPWAAKQLRYYVNNEEMVSRIGFISRYDVLPTARKGVQPISGSSAASARRQTRGYRQTITAAKQKAMARILNRKHGKTQGAFYHQLIPKIGPSYVPPRPIVGPFMAMHQRSMLQMISKLYIIKMENQRYGDVLEMEL